MKDKKKHASKETQPENKKTDGEAEEKSVTEKEAEKRDMAEGKTEEKGHMGSEPDVKNLTDRESDMEQPAAENQEKKDTADRKPEAPACPLEDTEGYKALAKRLEALEAEAVQLKAEIGSLKGKKGGLKARIFNEFLKSPVLGELTGIYLEKEGTEELYHAIASCLGEDISRRPGIRAELTADREKYRGENLTGVSSAAIILSIAGLIFAAMGGGSQMGILIVLFLVLAVVSAGIYLQSVKNTECCRYIVYVLTVLEDMEKDGKSKNL